MAVVLDWAFLGQRLFSKFCWATIWLHSLFYKLTSSWPSVSRNNAFSFIKREITERGLGTSLGSLFWLAEGKKHWTLIGRRPRFTSPYQSYSHSPWGHAKFHLLNHLVTGRLAEQRQFCIASRRMAVTLVSFALEKSNQHQWREEKCGYMHAESRHTHFSGRGMRALGKSFFLSDSLFFQQVLGQKPTFRKTLAISYPIDQ